MPTIEEATSGRLFWPRIIAASEMQSFYRKLVLTQPSLEKGEWWRLISYLFLHHDVDYLLKNISGILCCSAEVMEYGQHVQRNAWISPKPRTAIERR